jgi:hypothetical protein
MSELRDMVAIYGAIDQRLADAPRERRDEVAQLIPQYADEPAKWYPDLVAWTKTHCVGHDCEPFPELKEALDNLARAEPDAPRDPRRAHAITALLRADPGLLDDDEFAMPARKALGVAEDARLADLGEVEDRPCVGELELTPFGPATALETSFVTPDLSFEQACRVLNPENWTRSPFWCGMRPVPTTSTTSRRYHETVSLDCDHPQDTWTISTDLDFTWQLDLGNGRAGTQYRLPEGQPLKDDAVLVDEGSLLVETVDGGVRVHVTKRVLLSGPFDGAGLSLMMCALGFDTALKELVFQTKDGEPLTPEATPRRFGAAATTTDTAQPAAKDSLFDEAFDRGAAWVKASIGGCAGAAAATADKIAAGEYDADAFVQDVAGSSLRMWREAASGVDAWFEAMAATRGRRR